MPVHTMKNIRNGGSTAKREHLIALVRAYPELAEKAIEAGIEVEQLPAIESDVLRAIQLLREENKELRELMNEVKEKTLTQETLNRILNLIEKKS